MNCRYCSQFQESPWRVNPDPDGTGKKKSKLRHCRTADKYLPDTHEKCADFRPNPIFWCDRWDNWVYLDACIEKYNNGVDVCEGCRQHSIIVDCKRAESFLKRKEEAEAAKPRLLIRRKD